MFQFVDPFSEAYNKLSLCNSSRNHLDIYKNISHELHLIRNKCPIASSMCLDFFQINGFVYAIIDHQSLGGSKHCMLCTL